MFARPAVPRPRPAAIANWLTVVAILVFLMIVVGGITRLTESGLSMVRWEPISGAVPPLSAADWQAEFDHYRQSPQYQQVNSGMTLADFKAIFFWEYVHRLLGRLIGLAFALPLLFFWWRRAIPPGYGWKLAALLALGGLQGAIGWWMVASGLVDVPEVSHIRLAVHLLTALLILAGLIWVGLDLQALARNPGARPARITMLGIWALSLLFLQFLFGAYVAGLEAGYAFNSWPKMGEDWFPAEAGLYDNALRNFVDNPIVVQFVHRWLAFVVAAAAFWLAAQAWAKGDRGDAALLAGAVVAQILLGILTILSGVQIDIAVAHQGMAALLLAAMVSVAHDLGGEEAMTNIVSVYATFANEEEARRIARLVVEERLAACANIFPCHSVYRWQGAVEEAGEVAAIFKTTAETAPLLVARLAELHSYEVPAAVIWPVADALPGYRQWVIENSG